MLRRFQITLEDKPRGLAEELDLRAHQQGSEVGEFMAARVLACCVCFEPGIELASELCKGDEPTVFAKELDGTLRTWIEIGTPEARRLHRAAKAAKRVLVFPHRGPKGLELDEPVHRGNEIEVIDLGAAFLRALGQTLERNNRWRVAIHADELRVHDGAREHKTTIARSKPLRGR